MQELVPHVSCLVNPHELEAALAGTHSEVYVNLEEGYMKHVKLSGGRHIRVKVPKLPVPLNASAMDIKEELNFLPAGKIPYSYFEQIVHLFREVIRVKKTQFEAHAWILWRQDKGYFISVPKQTVSKASVNFTYDDESLPPGSIIVVDIH